MKFFLHFSFLLGLLVACDFIAPSCTLQIPLTSSLSSSTPTPSQQQPDQLKCKNEQGEEVDWFIAYKLPRNRTSSNALVRAGLAYAYILPPQQSPTEFLFRTKTERNTSTGSGGGALNISTAKYAFSSDGEGSFLGHHPHHDHEPEFEPGIGVGTRTHTKKYSRTTAAWTLSEKGIDSAESMVGQTLGKLYLKSGEDENAIAFLTYNDQPPVGPTVVAGGHSKGIIATSLASGFWVQHSVPHFPLLDPNQLRYQYPSTGKSNGQVFHCISLPSTKEVDNLARILEVTKPHVTNFSFPTDSLKIALPQLMAIVNHHKNGYNDPQRPINQDNVQLSPCENEIDENACRHQQQLNANKIAPTRDWDELEFQSMGGKSFHAYIKGPTFHEDIYSSWIAPTYKSTLKVQSWLNGPNPYPSNCSSVNYSVFNIKDKSIAGHEFSTHNDHSKWALSSQQPLVCISDLNRMEHQLKRGGVTVCFMDSSTWSTFNSSIIDVQPCPRLLTGGSGDGTADTNASIKLSSGASNNSNTNSGGVNGKDEGMRQNTDAVHSTDEFGSDDRPKKAKWIISDDGFRLDEEKISRRGPPTRHTKEKVKSRTYSFSTI